MTIREDFSERQPSNRYTQFILAYLSGFLLAFVFLWLQPISGKFDVPAWLVWINSLFNVFQPYVLEQIVIFVLAGIGGYIALKFNSKLLLCLCLGAASCPLILAVLGTVIV